MPTKQNDGFDKKNSTQTNFLATPLNSQGLTDLEVKDVC